MQGVKTPEGELPEGQEKLAWAMRVQSTRIFKLFQKFENTYSVAKRLFHHAAGRIYNAPLRGRKTRTPAGIGSWSGRPYRPPLQRTGGGAVGADFISARASLRFPRTPRFRRRGRRWCRRRILGQHRTIWQEHSAKDFASYESYKRAGILYVFPLL